MGREPGDRRVGGPEWLGVMTTPGTLNDGTKLTYAFGLEIMEDRGLRQVWHNGGLAGYTTMYVRYPDEHLSVAVFCNGSLEPDRWRSGWRRSGSRGNSRSPPRLGPPPRPRPLR